MNTAIQADSVINSLSASSMEDFVRRFHKGPWSQAKELLISRGLTLAWGSLALYFSFHVGDMIARTGAGVTGYYWSGHC